MTTLQFTQLAVLHARVLLAEAEADLKEAEAACPAKAECDRLSAQIRALEPEDFGGDLDKWEAACDVLLEEMKGPSDALYEATKPELDTRRRCEAILKIAELELLKAAAAELDALLPAMEKDLLKHLANGGPVRLRKQAVEAALRLNVTPQ
jgi:hypothetical protein